MDLEIDKQNMYNNDIHNSKITSYKPNNVAKMNTFNNKIYVLISREENHLNIRESCLEVEFNVSDNAGEVITNDANVRLVNNGVISLFRSIRLETTSGNQSNI